MLETPKAQGANYAKIPEDEVETEMDNQQVTREEIGWIAGFIDGEGYIGITMYKNHSNSATKTVKVELNVCNTDICMVEKYISIMNKMGVNPYVKKSKKYKKYNGCNKKDVHEVKLHRMAPIQKILKVILPHLTGMKKTRALLIYEFLESRLWKYDKCKGMRSIPYTEREIEIIQECLRLQKRGTSETTRKAELLAHQRKAEDSIEKKCEMAAKMLKLRSKGLSQAKIAKECGLSEKSGPKVGWWLRRLYDNETPIQILGYFPKYPSGDFDDIVRPYVKA